MILPERGNGPPNLDFGNTAPVRRLGSQSPSFVLGFSPICLATTLPEQSAETNPK